MKIFSYDYELKLAPPAELGAPMGDHQLIHQQIRVRADSCKEQRLSTILHEALEAADALCDWKMEHKQICALEVFLCGFLKDNGVDLSPLLRELERKKK